jgi:hypothetical protein
MTVHRHLFAAATLFLTLLVAGCSAAPTPDASPSASETTPPVVAAPTPTATPSASPTVDALTTVDFLALGPTRVDLLAAGRTVATLDYMGPAADAIATLTTVFGSAPVDESYRSTNHAPAGVYHAWGNVTLDERFYDEDRRGPEYLDWVVWPRWAMYLDGPSEGHVTLAAAGGRQAGDSWGDTESRSNASIWVCQGTAVDVQDIDSPRGPTRAAVFARQSDDLGSVRFLGAPAVEAQGCA